jgi:Ca2+-binding EF-hand superfamily protein
VIICKRAWPLQISEIFNLFDTDKGGSIDLGELDFAMNALGFQVKQANGSGSKHSKKAEEAMNAIAADG